jgi:hypothetical protein
MNRNKRDFVFHEFYFYQRVRHLGAFIPNTRRLRISRLLDLRLSGLLRYRTLWQEEGHDVLCGCLFDLLDMHCYCYWLVRKGRRFLCPRIGGCGFLFLVLRFIRHGVCIGRDARPRKDAWLT